MKFLNIKWSWYVFHAKGVIYMEKGILAGSVRAARGEETVKVVAPNNRGNKAEKTESKSNRTSFYVGNWKRSAGTISEKFKQAQKSAIKKLLDQFDADAQIDNEMAANLRRAEELGENVKETQQKVNSLTERREQLKQQYEIDPDSQEQRDLELMQKANAAKENPLDKSLQLTPEEEQRLAEMPPVTDYQEAMLLADEEEKMYRNTIRDNQKEIIEANATVDATKKALLKTHPMVDAKKEADEIIQAALDEQVSALYQEGVDKIDKDMKELEEKIKEKQEKDLEEKIKREKLDKEEAEKERAEKEAQETALSAKAPVAGYNQQTSASIQNNVKNLIKNQIAIDVDLKGLRFSKNI